MTETRRRGGSIRKIEIRVKAGDPIAEGDLAAILG
jgi:hypothetical protein